ncbi:hypothetical protein M514_09621 [Trichuris suis]|uniref:Calcineurin-like phosphoesterase domain-containing protein n=2 Tax=Trichuris suis TaxID=68888 RepID=A0A085N889_9BILA|nr:hypothetical protein M513_09621 [Trichuris suis]KFD65685.1 hypothetical protein M514_09621 [Trichuris suis]KHJ48503.1 hypothetical protein D918_00805 [Trichuris suis]
MSDFDEQRNNEYIGSFAIIADPQFGMLKPEQCDWSVEKALLDNTINAINALNEQPCFVAFVGDLTHAEPFTNAKRAQIQDFISSVRNLRARALFLCGNHDIGDKPTIDSLRAYRQSFGSDYYSVDQLDSKFIFLNSQLFFGYRDFVEESAMQWTWLTDLCNSVFVLPYRHVVVLQHVPPFVETIKEAPKPIRNLDMTFNLPDVNMRFNLLGKLGAVGVQQVFCGHLHRNAIAKDSGFEIVVTNSTTSVTNNGYRLVRVYKEHITHEYIPVPSNNLPTPGTFPRIQ